MTDDQDLLDIAIPGGTLSVRVTGAPAADGPPVVLIHGGPGLSRSYMVGLDRLGSAARRVVAYDQRGCGGSPFESDDPVDYDLDAHTTDLDAVLDAVLDGVPSGRAHLLGHSWGGVVAMHYAGRHPDRVASLILVDSCPPAFEDLAPGFERFGSRLAELAERGLVPGAVPDEPTAQLRAMAPVYFADPTAPMTHSALEGQEVFAHAGDLTAAVLPSLDLRTHVRAYRGPVLTVFGAQDPFGIGWATATHAAFAHARAELSILEGCGHLGWIECPDAFFSILSEWLDRF